MFGAGLQLQQATPGVANTGNAHLTGTLIADKELYSNNPNARLLKYGNNPSINYSVAFGGGAGAINLILGSTNVITDGNVIQNCAFVGNANAIGSAAHVGMTSFTVCGNNNTLNTAGTNDNILALTVFGASNQASRNGGFGNKGPIIVGYQNNWNGWSMPGDYVPGVLIDHQRNLSGLDNVTVIGPLRTDVERAVNDSIVIGNTLQTTVWIGKYRISQSQPATILINDSNRVLDPNNLNMLMGSITAPRVVTLPLASAFSGVIGVRCLIADASGNCSAVNTITVQQQAGDTINGSAAALVLNSAYAVVELVSDAGTRWTRVR